MLGDSAGLTTLVVPSGVPSKELSRTKVCFALFRALPYSQIVFAHTDEEMCWAGGTGPGPCSEDGQDGTACPHPLHWPGLLLHTLAGH